MKYAAFCKKQDGGYVALLKNAVKSLLPKYIK